ncbi:MAG: S1 RNA-binding domain-containing protein, partial [Eubacteriales bacterium]
VHPESYAAARAMLKKFRYSEDDVALGRVGALRSDAEKYGVAKLCGELDIGEPTLYDIIGELEKPGRDARDSMPPPVLRDDVMDMSDLAPGMIMTGTVRNVCDFGAFVDIGVHEDGLVHVSQISNTRVKHPSDVLAAGDIVRVGVLSVDCTKKRISLTMKL